MADKTIKSGSALIMITVIMAVLIIVATTALHTASMFNDLAMQRVKTHQERHSARALMIYSIACCKEIDTHKKKKKKYVMTLDSWPDSSGPYNGEATVIPQKRWYEVSSKLFEGTKRIAQSSCYVWKEKKRWKVASFVG